MCASKFESVNPSLFLMGAFLSTLLWAIATEAYVKPHEWHKAKAESAGQSGCKFNIKAPTRRACALVARPVAMRPKPCLGVWIRRWNVL